MSRLHPSLAAVLICFGVAVAPVSADPKTITLVVTFDQHEAQPEVVEALKSELAEIWRSEPVKLDWRPLESIKPGDSFNDLVVVHFKGDCHFRPEIRPFMIDERGLQTPGPFAYSPTVNGEVQPFSAVLCERVEHSVQSALEPGQYKKADALYGRALGRVLSHELYHILNQTRDHQRQGLAKKALTGRQLIEDDFRFDESGIRH